MDAPPRRGSIARKTAGCAALLACTAALVALVSVNGPEPRADMSPSGFGVNAENLVTQFPEGDWEMHMREMHAIGIRIVRTDAPWATVEPDAPAGARHTYHWQSLDRIVYHLAVAGLRWLPIADYSAPWAASQSFLHRPNAYSAPRDPSQFAAYGTALAVRYGPNGRFWRAHAKLRSLPVTAIEIWNEENGIYWQPAPDAAAYAQLYEDTRAAIHAVAPHLEVLVGGLAPATAATFLGEMLTVLGSGRGKVDAVGLHVTRPMRQTQPESSPVCARSSTSTAM